MTNLPSPPRPDADQAAFNAAWDLLTQWYRGRRIRAAEYRDRLGADVFALPEVKYALAEAEQLARKEAGFPPSEEVSEWLRAELPDRWEVYCRLLRDLAASAAGRSAAAPDRYSYLQPPAVPGELGRLGDFRVIREIGRGGMGIVFEVENETTLLTPKRRALKVLDPATSTPTSRLRFVQEAQIVHAIPHAKIVRVYTAAERGGVAYIEMEYVYGPNLNDLICHHLGGPVPLALAADLIRQIALGLAWVHRQGEVAHRDVKPANVLLEWVIEDDDYPLGWCARVCDFGLAAGADHPAITGEGHMPGTPLYLPREQLTPGAGRGQPAGDVYSLGIIAYELATGCHPFKCDSTFEMVAKLLAGVVESPRAKNAEIPEHFEKLIMWMLKPSPEERPSAEQVAAELARLLARDEVRTRPASLERVEPPSKPSAERPETVGATKKCRELPGGTGVLPQTTELPPVVPLALDLAMTVWKRGDKKKRGLPIDDPWAVPLQAGDHIRLEVRLNRPAFIYAMQLDAGGGAFPLSLPRSDDGREGVPETPRDRLAVPPGELEESVPLTDGPSGMEAFVVIVSEDPLGQDEVKRLLTLFASGTKQDTFDPLRGMTWIDTDEGDFSREANRGRVDLAAPRPIEDPVQRLRRLFRSDEVLKLIKVGRAVCYPFRRGVIE